MDGPSFQVVEQERDTSVNTAANRVERGWRVYYKDSVTGVLGDVFVPDSRYTAQGINDLIEHQLVTVRAVHALGG